MTPNRRTRALAALACAAAVAAAVVVAGPGYDTTQVRTRSGTVWLASNQTGTATLVDGASAEVAAEVPVGEKGAVLSVAQHGNHALVLDHRTGVLSRVDGATMKVSDSSVVLPPSPWLTVKAASGAAYGVDVHSGMVAPVDPDTLQKGAQSHLAEAIRPDNVAVDRRGRLWAVDEQTGDLVWLTDGERRMRSAGARSALLAVVGDQPALVDPGRGVAELLDQETGAVTRALRTDLGAGDVVAVSGSTDRSRLLIANSTRGQLLVCTFDTGSCAAPVHIGSPGANFGAPVEVGDHAVVPDHSTGSVTIVDLTGPRVAAQHQLFDHPAQFELIARNGLVFFNDPDGDAAGVLDLSGEVRSITKYLEEPTGGDTPPKPDPRAKPDQATKVDTKKPGGTIPRRADPPADANVPPPPPVASISVRPGNHGVVGDEFELTMVHQGMASGTNWTLGDGAGLAGTTIQHRWQQPGVYTVRAHSWFPSGRQVEAETTITVDPVQAPPGITQLTVRRPKPVMGESVHFGADTTGKPDEWAWTITKAGQSTPEATARTPEFDHVFAAPGTYTATLVVTAGTRTARLSRQFTVSRGAVQGWGFDDFGQTDIPDEAASGVVAIAAGGLHSMALKADGTVLTWGWGEGATQPPVNGNVVAIAAGYLHNLALRADGSVIAWGEPGDGRTAVPPDAQHDVVAIAAGDMHSLALTKNGAVIAWGQPARTQVPPDAQHDVIAIAAGGDHSMALRKDGRVVVWGVTGNGEDVIPPLATSGVVGIAAGYMFCSVLRADGSVIAWGNNFYGQTTIPQSLNSGVVTIDSSSTHGLALKADGSVVGWGDDRDEEASVPAEYDKGVLAVSAGHRFSLVLLE